MQHISTKKLIKNLKNPKYIFIDIRDSGFYNGFKQKGAIRGGHIKNALNITYSSISSIKPSKFKSYIKARGIKKDKTLVFYGNDIDDLKKMAKIFKSYGYKIKVFKDIISYSNNKENPLKYFKNYTFSISSKWLYKALKGKKVESYDGRDIMVFEVSWRSLKKSKEYKTHIKGAYHFDTNWIENAPSWNLSKPKTIAKNLLNTGITKDKLVVLYSQNQMAALRVFWALKWAGVEDVRFLNGGLSSWIKEGYPIERKINIPKVQKEFGVKIPLNPHINISKPKEIIKKQKKGLKLISNRTWEEYTGKSTGYSYIKKVGEPKGAIWGFAGKTSSDMQDFYNPDGTLRNPNEIFKLWEQMGIRKNDKLAFYCGTGWRGSVSWFITQLAGWEKTCLYDGGWNLWQKKKSLPIQKKAPKNVKKTNSQNNYGHKIKNKNSCKI